MRVVVVVVAELLSLMVEVVDVVLPLVLALGAGPTFPKLELALLEGLGWFGELKLVVVLSCMPLLFIRDLRSSMMLFFGFVSALRRHACRSDPFKLLHPSTLMLSSFF